MLVELSLEDRCREESLLLSKLYPLIVECRSSSPFEGEALDLAKV